MWNTVIGHESQKEFLKKYISSQQRPHGLLFIGQEGLQKKELALYFAKSLLCLNNTEADNCESCRLIKPNENTLNHPDLIIIEREKDEKTEKLKDISIEQIKELNKLIITKPILSQYKVCIINDIDRMTIYAANCFLKSLEEPPENTVIIMIARSEANILPTILSRVTKIKFYPIPKHLIKKELTDTTKERAKFLSLLSEGAINKAKELNNETTFQLQEKMLQLITTLPLKSPLGFINNQKWLDFPKKEVLLALDMLNLIIRDMNIYKYHSEAFYNLQYKDEIIKTSNKWNKNQLEHAHDIVSEAIKDINNNVNTKTTLETMVLKLNRIYNEGQ